MEFDQCMRTDPSHGIVQKLRTLTSPSPASQHLCYIEYLGVGSLLDQVQPVVLSNFCVSHNKIFLLSLCPHFSSLGVPYNHEIWLCHLINTIAARCTAPSAPSEAFVAATREYKALHAGDGKVKVNILAGGNIYGKNLWIRELYSFHWHFLTALTFYISCG